MRDHNRTAPEPRHPAKNAKTKMPRRKPAKLKTTRARIRTRPATAVVQSGFQTTPRDFRRDERTRLINRAIGIRKQPGKGRPGMGLPAPEFELDIAAALPEGFGKADRIVDQNLASTGHDQCRWRIVPLAKHRRG